MLKTIKKARFLKSNSKLLSVIQNFLSLGVLQVGNYILPLISFPYLYRVIGIENFGIISLASIFNQYFILFVDFGFNIYGVKMISENRNDREFSKTFFVSVTIAQLLLLIISGLIYFPIVYLFPSLYHFRVTYFISFLSVVGSMLMPMWLFQGLQLMKYVTFSSILVKSISILLILLLVKAKDDYLCVPLIYGIGAVLLGLISLIYACKILKINIRVVSFSAQRLVNILKDSSSYFLSRIAVSFYTVSNGFIIGLILGNISLGYYVVAEKIYSLIQSIYNPINGSIYPYMAANRDLKFYKKVFFTVVFINIIVVSYIYNDARKIMVLIFSSISFESILVFKNLLIACIFVVPSILLGYPLLGSFGFGKFVNITVIISSIFHFISLLALILFESITLINISFLVIITEFIVFFLRSFYVYKYI
ncbi:MAG: oligosaccharide flippase family protein [Cytophagales bacterium]|nr:oligosaccharide flippase family protein [Cytophagales bacterium]